MILILITYYLPTVERHLSAAKEQYWRIRFRGPHPDVHIPYLQALLSQRESHHLDEAVKVLSAQLSVHPQRHPDLLAVLWSMVLSSEILLSNTQKASILSALQAGLGKRIRDTAEPSRSLATATVQDLSATLHDAVFSPIVRTGFMDQAISNWVYSTCRAVLMHQENNVPSMQEQWNCLILLGVVRTSIPSASSHTAGILSSIPSNLCIADWQVICGLQHFQNVLQSVGSVENDRLVLRDILTTLWRNWFGVASVSSATRRPITVLRVICGTFFILSGRVQCRSVAEACHDYCMSEGLYKPLPSDSDLSSSGRTRLLTEQLTAFVLCGMRMSVVLTVSNDTMILTGPNAQEDAHKEGLAVIVGAAISLCSRYNPERAHQLQINACRVGLKISADVVAALGVSLADAGDAMLAVEYLTNPHLTTEGRSKVLSALLQIFDRQGRGNLPAGFIDQIGDAMLEIYASEPPAEDVRVSLQRYLLIMAQSRYQRRAVELIETISNHSSYLMCTPPTFWSDLLDALIRHRQFILARRMYDLAIRFHPRYTVQWQRTVILQFARRGAWMLASQMSREASPKVWRSLSLSIAKWVKFRDKPPAEVLTVQVPTFLSAYKGRRNSREWNFGATYATKLLVRAGRMVRAKRLYADLVKQGMEDASARTVMGNEILHGSMQHRSKRNARRVQKVLETLRELMSGTTHQPKQGAKDTLKEFMRAPDGKELPAFTPDRVTVNILMKSLLKWKDVDTFKVRALFDRMVQNGYPCPALPSPSSSHSSSASSAPTVGPFGTDLGANSDGLGFGLGQVKMEEEISFERHVGPLYRMFITAFYQRGDIYAAKKVVGILKAVKAEELAKAEAEARTERSKGK